jgi:hypothetical protein
VRLVDGAAPLTVAVHGGAILSATRSADGKALVTGGDDGLVAATTADGAVARLAERPRKWIDNVAAVPAAASTSPGAGARRPVASRPRTARAAGSLRPEGTRLPSPTTASRWVAGDSGARSSGTGRTSHDLR